MDKRRRRSSSGKKEEEKEVSRIPVVVRTRKIEAAPITGRLKGRDLSVFGYVPTQFRGGVF